MSGPMCELELQWKSVTLTGCESIVLELTGGCFEPFGFKLLVTTVYRQPSADIGAFPSDLEWYIHSTTVSQSTHKLLGDINIDTCKTDAISANYLNILSSAHYFNTIQIPTRFNSCLDHVNIKVFFLLI